jgi:hypothetical protein
MSHSTSSDQAMNSSAWDVLSNSLILDIVAETHLLELLQLSMSCKTLQIIVLDHVFKPRHLLAYLKKNRFILVHDCPDIQMVPNRDIAALHYGLKALQNRYSIDELFRILGNEIGSSFSRIPFEVFFTPVRPGRSNQKPEKLEWACCHGEFDDCYHQSLYSVLVNPWFTVTPCFGEPIYPIVLMRGRHDDALEVLSYLQWKENGLLNRYVQVFFNSTGVIGDNLKTVENWVEISQNNVRDKNTSTEEGSRWSIRRHLQMLQLSQTRWEHVREVEYLLTLQCWTNRNLDN